MPIVFIPLSSDAVLQRVVHSWIKNPYRFLGGHSFKFLN